MAPSPDPRVDAYIEQLPGWQREAQGHGNATARAIQIYEHDEINAPALLALLRAVIANNRAGGWRRLTGRAAAH